MSFFGTNIKKIRQVKGMSQKAFADLFDLNRGVISAYEEGRAEPKIETLLKVAHHFELDLDKFLTEPLKVNHIVSLSNIDQLLFRSDFEKENLSEIHLENDMMQKILARMDLAYEFTNVSNLLGHYQVGDILFLKKVENINDDSNLLVFKDEEIEYYKPIKHQKTDETTIFKIVGYLSAASKNVFLDIFERLEKLENK